MRLKAAFVVVAMAALGAAESSAAIYELGSSAPTAPPLEMSPDQARLGLAQALGVSRFYKLGAQGTADKRIEVLEQLAHMENRIGAVAGGEGRFLLSLAGVGAEDADGLPLNQPIVVMKHAMTTDDARQLLAQLAQEKAETISQPLQEIAALDSSFCVATPSIRDAESLVSNYKFSNYKSWQVGEENKGVTKEMTSVFNPDRSEDRHFMSEYLIFKAFVEKVVPRISEDKSVAFCHFQGLKDLVHAYGQDSTEVNLALSLFHKALARLAQPEGIKTTLILTPGSSGKSTGFEIASHINHKRSETPLTMASASSHSHGSKISFETTQSSSPPATVFKAPKRIDRCHASKDVCTNVTDSCASHGSCVEAASGCWTCACVPTVNKNEAGQPSTTNWAGFGCQKQDISVPFNLFFLFTIVIVLVLGWSIGLLYSIGNEELPSVLAAGVAPAKRA